MLPKTDNPNGHNNLATQLDRLTTRRTEPDEDGQSRTEPANVTVSTPVLPAASIYSDILKNISLTGKADENSKELFDKKRHLIIESRNQLNSLFDSSSGFPKIRKDAAARFNLIMTQPSEIQDIPRHDLRCCLCKSIISWPVWYWVKRYKVNQFHFFVCFDSSSPELVTAKCYRKD